MNKMIKQYISEYAKENNRGEIRKHSKMGSDD